ncbi:MAG TPA: DNA-binding protein [Candidatus Nitrosotalea sp.]|jgi:programmed cell death protein 5|nr:DNA-binding protein [Candidatus Nitrosotalea sp.]
MSSNNQNDDRNPSDAEVSAMKDSALKTLLTAEARLRLNNVRLVKPDLAAMVENYLLGLASQGRLNSQISDDQLKQILLSTQQPKRDFKINRK